MTASPSCRVPVFLFILSLSLLRVDDAASDTPAPARVVGAVESLAQQMVTALGALPASPLVVAAPLASDQTAPKGDELALRVATLMAGRMGATARAHPQIAQLGTARALAGKTGGLVYLQVEVVKGELRATADVYPVLSNGWDRIRNPLPPPAAHGFASIRIDGEVRAFLPPIVLEQATLHKARHDEGDILAAACGDLDGDGGNELALVSRGRVSVGRLRAGRFVVTKTAPWSSLSPRAPSPMREPLGTAAIARAPTGSGMALYVGTTDRGGVVLDADLVPKAALSGLPVALADGRDTVACVVPNAGTSSFEGPLASCDKSRPGALVTVPASRFDAVSAVTLVAADGASRPVVAAREPGGKLWVRFGEDASQTRLMDGVGAQVVLGDLDQDGVAEVVTAQESGADEVFVTSWTGSDLRSRRRFPAPAGVRALAICPPEERGAPALVAVVGAEVWIVR